MKIFGTTDIPETPEQRFWAKVKKSDGCWLWSGAVAGRYGQCRLVPKVKIPAHRYSYILHFGPIPDGMLICHRCDVPLCVRPDHLFLGSPADNMRDMVMKGRHPKRSASYRAKLTVEQVRDIAKSSRSSDELAQLYNVSTNSIRNIRIGKTWRAVQ